MNNRKSYKIVCHTIQTILLIRNMNDAEISAAYNVIRRKVEEYQGSPSTFTYMVMLAKIFLEDSSIITKMRDEVEDSDDPDAHEGLKEALEDIYFGVTKLYPIFNLDMILMDINSTLSSFGEGILDSLVERSPLRDKKKYKGKMFSTMEDILRLNKYLKRKVIGQEEAIDCLTDSIKLLGSGLEKHAAFFFLGPTGVGKTYVSKLLGKKFSGKFCKINCSEYSSPHEYAKLLGAPPGYVNSNEGGLLSKKAAKGNNWVILFDEIEKGHEKLHDLLLNLLEEGKVDDNKGDTLDFSKSIFICTSNIGLKDLKWNTVGFDTSDSNPYDEGSAKEEIQKAIHEKFKDEFINRFDEWVYFKPLNEDNILKIASLEIASLPIEKTKELLQYIAKGGYSERYGARQLKRFIKKNVAIKVADSILCKEIPLVGTKYTPKFNDDGELEIVNTKAYTGDEHGEEDGTDGIAKTGVSKKKRKAGPRGPATRTRTRSGSGEKSPSSKDSKKED